MGIFSAVEVATVLFATAALGGVTLALIRFRGSPLPPAWLGMLHGFIAAAGLNLLAYGVLVEVPPPSARWALILFLLAALGGMVMYLGYRAKSKPLPKALVVLHGLVAVSGFVLFLVGVVKHP